MDTVTVIALILLLFGILLALVDTFAPRPRLLHVAVLLIGVGALVGVVFA